MSIDTRTPEQAFIDSFDALAQQVHDTAVEKGWWESDRNDGEVLCLVHSEISEALEGLRHGNPPDDKIPEFTSAEAECADAIIRLMDMGHNRWRIAAALIAKMAYNKTRPYRHGGKAF